MAKSTKQYGLRLTLGGAPDTPHQFPGFPGLYRPSRPTPVGGPGEATLEQAQEVDKKRGFPLELVEMTAKEVDEAREGHLVDLDDARHGIVAHRKAEPTGAEIEQIKDEMAAIAAQTSTDEPEEG